MKVTVFLEIKLIIVSVLLMMFFWSKDTTNQKTKEGTSPSSWSSAPDQGEGFGALSSWPRHQPAQATCTEWKKTLGSVITENEWF